MKNCIVMLGMILLGGNAWGQSLGKERITMLRESVVRILIEGTAVGTGFFISEKGWVATCYHVIAPALKYDSAGVKISKIEIETYSGEKVEAGIFVPILQHEGRFNAFVHDYALIAPKQKLKSPARFLIPGTTADFEEGDEVYTAGYPLGIKEQFVSKGIISTIWDNKVTLKAPGLPDTTVTSKAAYLDMTLNKGNSGGPIIKMGAFPEDDRVIGIATFILNPYANLSEQLLQIYNNQQGVFLVNGFNQNEGTKVALQAIANNSIGVSGMYFIDYVKALIPKN